MITNDFLLLAIGYAVGAVSILILNWLKDNNK